MLKRQGLQNPSAVRIRPAPPEFLIFMIFIDVRTKEEYENGHIDGATNHDIMAMMEGVFPNVDKNEAITLYCESGNRSMMAKDMMEKIGFKNVINGGGMGDLSKSLK